MNTTTDAISPDPIKPHTGDNPPSTIDHQPTIARLPKVTRDMINLMLDDGLPYHVIINPCNYFKVLNSLCNLTNAQFKCEEKH